MFVSISQRKFPIVLTLIILLTASVVLLLTSLGYSYRVSKNLFENNALIEHTDSLVSKIDLLGVTLEASESGVHAFAASEQVEFLYQYEHARNDTRAYLKALQVLTRGDSLGNRKVQELDSLVKKRFQLLAKAVAIEKGEAIDKQGLEKRRGRAQLLNNRIEQTSKELKTMLETFSAQKKQESRDLLHISKWSNLATIALGLILAGLLGGLVYNDITEREAKEDALLQLNNQKSQFFSIISHDLRGPTRNTRLLLEMMDDPAYASGPDEARKMATLALQSVRQTEMLVEDLLTWGRLQMEQVDLRTTRFRPFESAEKVCGPLQAAAALKNIALENNIPRDLFIRADAHMVETVLRNLLSNAIKFTPDHGKVRVEARRRGDFVELVVEDNGVGMQPEVMDKIFSVHVKHTTKGTAGEPGTGLGLAVCREFVERNGGTIGVESQPGQGSKFNVRLPVSEEMVSS
ncbi:MAG: CHASE3 domain-containing protein [Cytophagales bacterium]|nr:CHASE3 domain-containing protein [Cytophagales bacterium]